MRLIDIVRKLVGPIDPVGETNADLKRLENLVQFQKLFREMHEELARVAFDHQHSHMHSCKVIGEKCASFLHELGYREE